ncbi:MAG: hypothetical protein R2865_13080 [Deinococcales bacterium]
MVFGEGHFLGHDQTLASMEKDYFIQRWGIGVARRIGRMRGLAISVNGAREKTRQILFEHYPEHIDEATDQKCGRI